MKTTISLKTNLNKSYWESRYQSSHMGWDIGYASPPLTQYIDQLRSKDLRILIPGAGSGYEAEYLLQQGFTDITVIDISQSALELLSQRIPSSTHLKILEADFFKHQGTYDLILEQTFFCAIEPRLRPGYIKHCHHLLVSGGKIAGVLFDLEFAEPGPPFGGTRAAYIREFSSRFHIKKAAPCYNSIKPRSGKEVFVIFEKKNLKTAP